jgi:hypothetical protein
MSPDDSIDMSIKDNDNNSPDQRHGTNCIQFILILFTSLWDRAAGG